ncbi:amidohydrolase [Rhizorhabdus wittichii RW1]|uniref:Amidohydrolase n=1 Tax=Rhizorhabdus wittichii (strain DSM 6014 / CCUG 31198 / JCM 15750 / NBRC 105917 / EY 4224 / RW1) TaxID=392499 RepID=A0A9J9HF04_RHIWR|nr:amidohydrolase [Rhizorhabdus wittichii RW1]
MVGAGKAWKGGVVNLILTNGRVFDGASEEIAERRFVWIEDGVIREVGDVPPAATRAEMLDLGGRFLMPGLIDAHFHAYGIEANPARIDLVPPVLRGLRAKRLLEAALQRGFTTVRDAAGADAALATALRDGLIEGPRLFYPGLALSQTGGHGDLRSPDHHDLCACAYCGALTTVVDGPDEMRKAVREQLRLGAHQIKLFVSGGVLSPSDPIWMNQFSIEEIRVAVEEAAVRRTYVMAHAHTNEAVLRCVANGVRSIEHATMIENDGARAIVEHDAFAVPTLAVGDAIRKLGPELGLSSVMLAKAAERGNQAVASIDKLRSAGAKIGFGTDLLGPASTRQSLEFGLRREVLSPIEILRSATSVNAALIGMEGRLGTVAPGAFADLIVLDGDPLADVALFERHEAIRLIVKDGRIHKNSLPATAAGG